MANFKQQLKKAKKLTPTRLSNDLFSFIRKIEKEIVKLNVDQINIESKDIFNKNIGFYSYATEVITNGAKKQGEPFTGKDSGDWLKSFFVDIQGKAFRLYATDPKTHLILDSENWLSDDLFGLSDKDLKALISSRLAPFFIQNLRDKLDL